MIIENLIHKGFQMLPKMAICCNVHNSFYCKNKCFFTIVQFVVHEWHLFFNAKFEWEVILISSIVAVVGILLAQTAQRIAGGIAGFVTGWYITSILLSYSNTNLGQIEFIGPIIIGFICSILIIWFFNWGVIVASSLAGSVIIVSGMTLARNVEVALMIMLAGVGVAIQTIWFMQES